ncbi:monomethylamine:corrinoid methyltransferase [Acetohalobium arabaticum]
MTDADYHLDGPIHIRWDITTAINRRSD